jgi:hypothetical protein
MVKASAAVRLHRDPAAHPTVAELAAAELGMEDLAAFPCSNSRASLSGTLHFASKLGRLPEGPQSSVQVRLRVIFQSWTRL